MAELIDKDKVKELPVYEFGVSLLSAEKYVKLSDLEKLLTTTEAEIRNKAIDKTVAKLKDWMFENDGLSVKDVCEIDEIAEQLKGE